LSRIPGNVREFDTCQGNVRKLTKNQGNVREKSSWIYCYVNLPFWATPVFNMHDVGKLVTATWGGVLQKVREFHGAWRSVTQTAISGTVFVVQ